MVLYSSLYVKSAKSEHDVQIYSYSTLVLRNDIIYVVKSVDSDDNLNFKICMRPYSIKWSRQFFGWHVDLVDKNSRLVEHKNNFKTM